MSTPAVLELNALYRRFKSSQGFEDTEAVNGVTLKVAAGEVLGLVGPDGAGKTTTMRMAAGLLTPSAGEVKVLGQSLQGKRQAVRNQVGYMPQHYSLYGDLSVQENLRFFAGMYGVPRAELKAREKRLLEIARLERFRDRPAGALSGGMYKKLALSCALIHQPRLLLLDEPTNGVDPVSRRELWTFLDELVAEGVSVLVSTPYMDEAERCQRVGLLVEGKIVALDTPSALSAAFDAQIFQVVGTQHLEALERLKQVEGVLEVYTVGRKLHVVAPQAAALRPSLAAALKDVGLFKLEEISPSFEDIFMHLSAPHAPHASPDEEPAQ